MALCPEIFAFFEDIVEILNFLVLLVDLPVLLGDRAVVPSVERANSPVQVVDGSVGFIGGRSLGPNLGGRERVAERLGVGEGGARSGDLGAELGKLALQSGPRLLVLRNLGHEHVGAVGVNLLTRTLGRECSLALPESLCRIRVEGVEKSEPGGQVLVLLEKRLVVLFDLLQLVREDVPTDGDKVQPLLERIDLDLMFLPEAGC